MHRLKSAAKKVPIKEEEDTFTTVHPRSTTASPRVDLTPEQRASLKIEKKKKFKNSDVFEKKGK
jgi:hypothetical protein